MTDGFSEERKNEGSEFTEPWTRVDDANLILHRFEEGLEKLSNTQLIGLRLSLTNILEDINNEWKTRPDLMPLEIMGDKEKEYEWLSRTITPNE